MSSNSLRRSRRDLCCFAEWWRQSDTSPALAGHLRSASHQRISPSCGSGDLADFASRRKFQFVPGQWHSTRTFASGSVEPASEEGADLPTQDVRDAQAILRQVSVRGLKTHLRCLAEQTQTISVQDLVQLVKKFAVAHTEAQALQVIDALHVSGVVLRFRQQVYMKPDEIADMVITALPDTFDEAQAKVEEIESQLEPLRQQLDKIERKAQFWSGAVAYGGLGVLTAQFALFARLTYWELSWDVMEPLSYFTGQAAVIACYMYFLATRRDFTYAEHFSKVTEQRRRKFMGQQQFDYHRYEQLRRDLDRWQAYKKSMKR